MVIKLQNKGYFLVFRILRFLPPAPFLRDLFSNVSLSVSEDGKAPAAHAPMHTLPGITEAPGLPTPLYSAFWCSGAYRAFADDEEGVPSCTLPDDILPVLIVCLQNRNSNRST